MRHATAGATPIVSQIHLLPAYIANLELWRWTASVEPEGAAFAASLRGR